MNTPPDSSPLSVVPKSRAKHARDTQGIALVLVLGMLIIILGLAVTFMSRVSLERTSSVTYSASASSRQLANMAVNLVEGQIMAATTQDTNGNVAWASQPGMIRTYGSGSPGGYKADTNLLMAYKLYSSDALVTNVINFTNDLPTTPTWGKNDTAVWTDLNIPVTVVDSNTTNLFFPIVDPAATNSVEQFSVSNSVGIQITSGTDTKRRLPMPVKWLYALQDGTLVSPLPGEKNRATIAGATKTNPIVGRIAFWTDDDTCKVNINTASEGVYWDAPRASATSEVNFADRQPMANEFQRFPGHPAMTSLSPVFFYTNGATTTPLLTASQLQAIYDLLPRVQQGGSMSGSNRTFSTNAAVTIDRDRLFTSVDELLFQQNRTTNSLISAEQIERAKFFLTATSKAPETTLFGTPRIAIWPVDGSTQNWTIYDKLIAFSSTVSTNASTTNSYYFQRNDPKSSTADYQLGRNPKLFGYLANSTTRAVPGFSSTPSFATKYGNDRYQILAEIFDYIRTINLDDANLSVTNRFAGRGALTPSNNMTMGYGQVAPTKITNNGVVAQGFGRFPTISEAGIVLITTADGTGFTTNTASSSPAMAPLQAAVASIAISQETGKPLSAADQNTVASNNLAKLCSGVTNNRTTGTDMGYAPFLDVGYTLAATSRAGQTNDVFDWSPTINSINKTNGVITHGNTKVSAASLGWTDTNICYFDPYTDLNGDGQWETNEPFVTNTTSGTDGKSYYYMVHEPCRATSSGKFDPRVGKKSIEALFMYEWFIPGMGWPPIQPSWCVKIDGLNTITINDGITTTNLGFPSSGTNLSYNNGTTNFSGAAYDTRVWGGASSPRSELFSKYVGVHSPMPADSLMVTAAQSNSHSVYPFVSRPVKISSTATNLTMVNGTITISIYNKTNTTLTNFGGTNSPLSTITIPAGSLTIPVPKLVTSGTGTSTSAYQTYKENWWDFANDGTRITTSYNLTNNAIVSTSLNGNASSGSPTNGRIAFVGQKPYSNTNNYGGVIFRGGLNTSSVIENFDVVRTWVPAQHSDYRLLFRGSYAVAFTNNTNAPATNFLIHGIVEGGGGGDFAQVVQGTNNSAVPYNTTVAVNVGATNANWLKNGDWDNGLPSGVADGTYLNFPDVGNIARTVSSQIPYFDAYSTYSNTGVNLFSPYRQIPSAGVLGSLPTGMMSNIPYQTLLFRPQTGHYGTNSPPDHLITDLFWMPVVQPYAISENFSTAGKINLNYAMAPFSYIKRGTGMAALLHAEQITAIPNSAAKSAKSYNSGVGPSNPALQIRFGIDIPATLAQFDDKFAAGDIFRSGSQICEEYLIPTNSTLASMTNSASGFWSVNSMTGENSRERPYANLLGRVTTKSNTYTVHYKAQSLKKVTSSDPTIWNDATDKITGEYRGSTTIERYLNPDDSRIPDYASTPNSGNLESYYKWRVLNNHQFSP